jgi:hypothetical protein
MCQRRKCRIHLFIPIQTRHASRHESRRTWRLRLHRNDCGLGDSPSTQTLPPRRARLDVSVYGCVEASFTSIKILTVRSRQ